MKTHTTLSQCLIVKNEEKNIRKALSWGKGIVCEQIVVDTGSNDATVQIAEEMGAKVYHFPWIGDFAAAKNFAIEKATGDWIAFLDADEYVAESDVQKVIAVIAQVEKTASANNRTKVIRCRMLHLDDEGKVFSETTQDRFFKHTPKIRYKGAIHEQLTYEDGVLYAFSAVQDIKIFHTGYSEKAYAETNKIERNIDLLTAELEKNPEDYNAMTYLADSLFSDGQTELALKFYRRVRAYTGDNIKKERRFHAGHSLLRIITVIAPELESPGEVDAVFEQMVREDKSNPDAYYFMGEYKMHMHAYEQAKAYFQTSLEKLEAYKGFDVLFVSGELEHIYASLTQLCERLKNPQECIRYAVLTLRINPYLTGIFNTVLMLLKNEPGEAENPAGTYRFISGLYHMDQLRDQLFTLKCAKLTSFTKLETMIYETLPEEEKASLKKTLPSSEIFKAGSDEININNYIDVLFYRWYTNIKQSGKEKLMTELKGRFLQIKENAETTYSQIIHYYKQYPYWGELLPEQENYEVFRNRIDTVTENLQQFIWLYNTLSDYRSKSTLTAIVNNWTDFNMTMPEQLKEYSPRYFDPDLISCSDKEVFVDIGAYNGDTIQEFVNAYGMSYKRIYCYEVTPESFQTLVENTKGYENIVLSQKGAASKNGILHLAESETTPFVNALSLKAHGSEVEVVSVDEDIKEPVTFIKINACQAEQDVLEGCRETIKKYHPKLAISTYYKYEDIWKIPRMIHEIDPSYQFYMRYYGGNLVATDFVLYAL